MWREARPNDRVCVTATVRRKAAADNRAQEQRRATPRPGTPWDACRTGFVWREATATDHVCVTGQTRLTTATQNRRATKNVHPACRASVLPVSLHTEFAKPSLGPLPPKPSYSFTVVQSDGTLVGVSHGPLAIATDRMWNPGEAIRVSLSGGSDAVRAKIQRYANEWSKWANIRFLFVSDPASAVVRAEVSSDKLSWSTVGRDALTFAAPERTMNFGWLTDSTADDEFSRVVTHEFGHALGLIHEHQSPAAGIPWDRPKAIEYYKRQDNWDEAQVQMNIFDQASASTTNFSAFDPQSIMLYAIPRELTTNGYSVGSNRKLSSIDKQFIATFYPFPPGARGTLHTGDDCDTIAFDLSNGVPEQDGIRFLLRLGPNVTWWKSIQIPTQGNSYVELEAQDREAGDTTMGAADFDPTRPIRFKKAKVFGVHTGLDFTWDVMPALSSGSRVILDWNRDSCGG